MKYLFIALLFLSFLASASNVQVLTQSLNWEGSKISLSESNDHFLTWSQQSKSIQVWDLITKNIIKEVHTEHSIVQLIRKKNSTAIVLLTDQNEIIVYDWLQEKQLAKLEGNTSPIIYTETRLNKIIAFTHEGRVEWNDENYELENIQRRPKDAVIYNFRYLNYDGKFVSCDTKANTFTLDSKGEKTTVKSKNLTAKTSFYQVGDYLYKTNNDKSFLVYSSGTDWQKTKFVQKAKLPEECGKLNRIYLVNVKGKKYAATTSSEHNDIVLLNLPALTHYKTFKSTSGRTPVHAFRKHKFLFKNHATHAYELFDLETEKFEVLAESKNVNITHSEVIKDRYLLQVDEHGYLTIWDLELGILKERKKIHNSMITGLEVINEFKYVTTSYNGTIKEWHILQKQPVNTFNVGGTISNFHTFNENKTLAYFIKNRKQIFEINLITGKTLKRSKYDLRSPPVNGKRTLIGDLDYTKPIKHVIRVAPKRYAFTIEKKNKASILVLASWEKEVAKQIQKIELLEGESVQKLIYVPTQKKYVALIKGKRRSSKVISYYPTNGRAIKTYVSPKEITALLYDAKKKKLLVKERSEEVLKELDFYARSKASTHIVTHQPTDVIYLKDYVIFPQQNGITAINDVKTASNLLSIFNLNTKEDWLVIDADGRFEGTEQAQGILKITNGQKTLALESYFDRYYTPNLLIKTLKHTQLDPVNNINLDQLPPIVTLSGKQISESHNKEIFIKFRAVGIDAPLKSLHVYQNGKVVEVIDLKGQTDKVVTSKIILNAAYGSENYIYALAKDKNGLTSEKVMLVVDFKGVADEKPDLYIFAVGINEYKNPKYTLNYAVDDATSIVQKFKSQNQNVYENIYATTVTNAEATKANIVKQLETMQEQMKENDVFVFFYAGHGVTYDEGNKQGEFFMVTQNITKIYGNYNEVKNMALSSDFLQEFSAKINPQKQLFLIDACHSGGALGTLSRGQKEEQILARLARSTGTYWITASSSEQTAAEVTADKHGAFTYTLLKALDQNDLTVRSLCSYVERELPVYTEEKVGEAQYPMAYGFGNDFPIKK